MEEVLEKRPHRIGAREGKVWMEPIERILKHLSGDLEWYVYETDDAGIPRSNIAARWEWVLNTKREDEHYEDLKDTLSKKGFTRPLTASYKHFDGGQHLGDGHHRLAAAIDLGFTHVPVYGVKRYEEPISRDSGSWEKGKPAKGKATIKVTPEQSRR